MQDSWCKEEPGGQGGWSRGKKRERVAELPESGGRGKNSASYSVRDGSHWRVLSGGRRDLG